MLIIKTVLSLLLLFKNFYFEESESFFIMLAIITAYCFIIPRYYKCLNYSALILLLSFFISKGYIAGFFVLIWILSLVYSVIKSVDRLDYIVHLLIAAGSVWLLAARSNLNLLGFYTPWTELTAIHLTVAGALTICVFKRSTAFLFRKSCNLFITAQLIGVALTAIGILGSALLESIGTAVITINLTFWALSILTCNKATYSFKIGAIAIIFGVSLAAAYHFLRPEFLTIATMSASHGMLNLFGFIVPISFTNPTK